MTALILASARSPTGWWRFPEPLGILETRRCSRIPALLEELGAASAAGYWAVGFLAYEAASAFDPALTTLPPGEMPLAWFAITHAPSPIPPPDVSAQSAETRLGPSAERAERRAAIQSIRRAIARGDVYQVNYTYRLCGSMSGGPLDLFSRLQASQRGKHAACLVTPEWAVLSASPELFFARHGDRVISRPMKGTAMRGRTTAEDHTVAKRLANSQKERAENLMITDMVRNDLGRIARAGSVCVTELFRLERYPTLWQMVSEVEAQTRAPLPELLAALFPAASITGAPKASAMHLIRELESTPREIYTGTAGWCAPGGDASFNVAIRTAWWSALEDSLRYGTGGGIVWDSRAAAEDREARAKAQVLVQPEPSFALLETMAWRSHGGFRWLRGHLDRMESSADYFDFPFDGEDARAALEQALAPGRPQKAQRVRLLLTSEGQFQVELASLERGSRHWRLAFAKRPVDPESRFLFHKTTYRDLYAAARRERPDHDDVIFWNPSGEATETTVANLIARIGGEWVTPATECGLLPGVARRRLLEKGWLRERRLPLSDLRAAETILLINSVRGFLRIEIDWETLPRKQ